MEKIKNITISNYINSNYRDYALYTINSRGIPNFYDGLTPVQRLILLNTPLKNTKTLSVIGNCFNNGYPHGDSSLAGAISKNTRTFNCALNLLNGDGFFGNSINTEAASPRYTSVSLNKITSDIINKFKHLNEYTSDKLPKPLNLEIPLGLLTLTVGIAVGYKSMILPRKLEDINNYLNGKIKSIKPYFMNFNGSISKFEDLDNSWLFEGNIEINNKQRTITIKSLPPLLSYKSFLNKLDKIISDSDVSFENYSNNTINILLNFKNDENWQKYSEKIIKITKQVIRENIVFVKDRIVLEYNKIEDYLDDFKKIRNYTYQNDIEYQIKYYENENIFLNAKIEYMKFMKESEHDYSEIDKFLSKYELNISERLSRILLKSLNKTELNDIKKIISDNINKINDLKIEYQKIIEIINNTDFTLKAKQIKEKLIDNEIDEINGIEIYQIEEEDGNDN